LEIIVYEVRENAVYLLAVGHRKKIYEGKVLVLEELTAISHKVISE